MRNGNWRGVFLSLVAASLLTACVGPAERTVSPKQATSTAASGPAVLDWQRTELYFALRRTGEAGGEANAGPWSDKRWQSYLDEVVTPEFPAGFSVFDAYGQWKNSGDDKVYRLHSKVVVILHPKTDEDEARIERLRTMFKTLTGQESVLRATQPAAVEF